MFPKFCRSMYGFHTLEERMLPNGKIARVLVWHNTDKVGDIVGDS